MLRRLVCLLLAAHLLLLQGLVCHCAAGDTPDAGGNRPHVHLDDVPILGTLLASDTADQPGTPGHLQTRHDEDVFFLTEPLDQARCTAPLLPVLNLLAAALLPAVLDPLPLLAASCVATSRPATLADHFSCPVFVRHCALLI